MRCVTMAMPSCHLVQAQAWGNLLVVLLQLSDSWSLQGKFTGAFDG